MSYEIEYALSRLIEKEILTEKDLEFMKLGLVSRPDFDTVELYEIIDIPTKGAINFDDLKRFFQG